MAVTQRRYKLKNGKTIVRYQAEVSISGMRIATQTFDTRASAHLWHDDAKRKAEAGLWHPENAYRFSDCFNEYVAKDFQLLRKSSMQARQSRFRYFMDAPICSVKMCNLTAKDIDHWMEWMRKHPTIQNKSRRSFKEEFRLLRIVLRWYRENIDPSFVVPLLVRHRKMCFYKPLKQRQLDYFITPLDVPKWLNYLELSRPDPVYYRIAAFMVLTGWRLGEAAGLCWDAVSLRDDESFCRVTRTLSWDYHTKEPYFQDEAKSADSVRIVRLCPYLVQMLNELKLKGLSTGPVFLNSKGSLLRDNTVRQNFNAAFRGCNLPWSGSHIARHTWGTLGLIASSDIPAVQAVMGHKDSKQTLHYAKVIAMQTNKVPDLMAEYVGLLPRSPVENHVIDCNSAKNSIIYQ